MGIGYQGKLTEETTNRWWEKMYDQAASNIGSNTSESDKKIETQNPPIPKILTDEELFIACGGRTAHKAARHGLRLNGKLERIDDQEKHRDVSGEKNSNSLGEESSDSKDCLGVKEKEKKSKLKNVVLNDDSMKKNKRTKSKKNISSSEDFSETIEIVTDNNDNSEENRRKKKKSRKHRSELKIEEEVVQRKKKKKKSV